MQLDERTLIYAENAASHDVCAATHDLAVPYIYRQATRTYYWNLLCALLGNQNALAGADVLELGCGTGTYTDYVLRASAARFTGLDLSREMLRRAREKYPDSKCEWVCDTLENYACKHLGTADVIFSFSFLHHLPDIREGLEQIRGILKPGGTYVALHEIIVPREQTWVEKLDQKIESVFGSSVNSSRPWIERMWHALPGRLTGRRGVAPGTEMRWGTRVDYVDFQLNNSFDLQTFAAEGIDVVGYCYLAFPQLMRIRKPINHRALIMRVPR